MGSKHRLLPWIHSVLAPVAGLVKARSFGPAEQGFLGLSAPHVRYSLGQNNRDITRISTYAMADQFEADLRQLKQEFGL